MFRFSVVILFLVCAHSVSADTICTLVYDVDNKNYLFNEGDCDYAISPASTFKIPLSLIGYDSGYLTNLSLPELPFHADYPASLPSHKQATSPTSWIKNSVVWYSQLLTEWLGMNRLSQYVKKFDYGNQDLSGDADKNNGLTRAWLSSSLKITPNQQLLFLQKLLSHELSVSPDAYRYTEQLLKQDTTIGSFDLYGKTGTVVSPRDKNAEKLENRQFGWFVGWVQKNDKKFIFVNIVNKPKQEGVFVGPKAKAEIQSRLETLLAN